MTPDPVVLRHDDPIAHRHPQDGRRRVPPHPDHRGRPPDRRGHRPRRLPPPRGDARLTARVADPGRRPDLGDPTGRPRARRGRRGRRRSARWPRSRPPCPTSTASIVDLTARAYDGIARDRRGARRRPAGPRRRPARRRRAAPARRWPPAPIASIRIAACSRTARASSRAWLATERSRGAASMISTRPTIPAERYRGAAGGRRATLAGEAGLRRDPRRRRGRHALPGRLSGDAARAPDDARHPGRRRARRSSRRGSRRRRPVVPAGRRRATCRSSPGRRATSRTRSSPGWSATRAAGVAGGGRAPDRGLGRPAGAAPAAASRSACRARASSSRRRSSAGCGSSRTPTRSRC